jgi:hypothetical protein
MSCGNSRKNRNIKRLARTPGYGKGQSLHLPTTSLTLPCISNAESAKSANQEKLIPKNLADKKTSYQVQDGQGWLFFLMISTSIAGFLLVNHLKSASAFSSLPGVGSLMRLPAVSIKKLRNLSWV